MKASLFFSSLSILSLLLLGYANAANESHSNSYAVIEFAGSKDGKPDLGNDCMLIVERGTKEYVFGKDVICPNDDMYYYHLWNVPSAVRVTFHSEKSCSTSDSVDWYFVTQTYINNVTGNWELISNIKGKQPGDIISKGLLYKRGNYDHGNIGGKLSCVTVEY
jgi:hypothetical protein